MKSKIAIVSVALLLCAAAAFADDAAPQMTAEQKAMMEKMMKAATPGPQHAMLAKLAGDWTCSIKYQMDPAQPAQEAQSTSTVTTLMDGRYIQETSSGQMMGAPFNGMGLYGYDNVSGKFVSSWIDNMGTGIMSAVGTADASGKVINWTGSMNDPVTGKATKERMVMTLTDDDHHTSEMFAIPPGGKKEMKMMTINYVRNASAAAH